MTNPVSLTPLFAQLADPPAARSSVSSKRAAARAKEHRPTAIERILVCLADAHPTALTREYICARTQIRESTACARLFEMRPEWVEQVVDGGKTSSGIVCDTYRLTAAGLARTREARTL